MIYQPKTSNNNQQVSMKKQYSLLFKGSLVILIACGYLLYRFLFQIKSLGCIYDAYQDVTIKANRPLVQNQLLPAYEGNSNNLTLAGKAFIGTGQVAMDLWIAVLGLIWIVKIKNMRAFSALGIFFLIRGLIFLNIQKFPFPENLVWRSPGFFSFTVPYDHTRDFYYSGHTGSLFIILLQLIIIDLKIVSVLACISLIFMMNMLIITRVHYVIDIIGALIIGIWLFKLSIRYVIYVDKLLSLPFFAVNWIIKNKCSKSQKAQTIKQNNDNKQNIQIKGIDLQNMVNGLIIRNYKKANTQIRKAKLLQIQMQEVKSAQRLNY